MSTFMIFGFLKENSLFYYSKCNGSSFQQEYEALGSIIFLDYAWEEGENPQMNSNRYAKPKRPLERCKPRINKIILICISCEYKTWYNLENISFTFLCIQHGIRVHVFLPYSNLSHYYMALLETKLICEP